MGQGIDDGGLADVGPADDGQLDGGRGRRRARCFHGGKRGFRGQKRDRRLHEGADAALVNGADGKILREAQLGEHVRAGFGLVVVRLVDGDEDRFAGVPQTLGDFAVQGNDALLQIDNQNNDGGGFDGQFDLLEGGLDDDIAGLLAAQQAQAAGVHQGEGASVPLGLDADAVACDPRLVVNDGDAFAGDAIKQGRLAHVGPSDNGDKIGRIHVGK